MLELPGFYEHIFQSSQDSVFILSNENKFVDCNISAIKFLSCNKEGILGKSVEDFSPAYQEMGCSKVLLQDYYESAEKGRIREFEWTFLSPAKGLVNTRIYIYCNHAPDGIKKQILVQEKKVQGDRLEGNEFSELLLNIFPGLFFIYDVTSGFEKPKLLRFSQKWFCEKLGYRVDDLSGDFPEFMFSPSESGKTKKLIRELILHKNSELEIEIRHAEGYDIPYLFLTRFIEAGEKKFFTGLGIDISERKYTELALKQSEEYFKNIFNSISEGILVMDMDFTLMNANSRFFRMFGYNFEEIVFQNVLDLIPPESRSILKEHIERYLESGIEHPIELDITKKTGEIIPVEINSIAIKYGERTGILTTVNDLTERKELEKEIFNSEIRSEERERERFAKELHDGLGPILSTCKIYLHTLNEILSDNDEQLGISRRSLDLLDDALSSIKEISNNLSPHVLRNFGLVQAVVAFTHNLENLPGIKFEVHYNYDERLNELIEFTAYRIITELINNSIKHSEASLVVVDIILEKSKLKVTYSDNGKGFDLKNVRKMKKGFGLRNIENRISKFNGSYSFSTSPSRGVKVKFILDINQSEK
jgi:PAS domain S-box-containing protein